MPKALVIGSRGQDGTYLTKLLKEKGYELIALTRGGIEDASSSGYQPFSLNYQNIAALLSAEQPDECYYLAAFHKSSEDSPIDELELLYRSFETNTNCLSEVLYAIGRCSPNTRLFYAASSHVFGEPPTAVQNENTPMNPINAYGISKAAGVHLCKYFRTQHSLYASAGILYNHESPRRPNRFLSKKVVRAAVKIKRGSQEHLILGDLDTLVDWGFAGDYVKAMWKILQLREPDDFVIATGILHSVRDFVTTAFRILDLEWSKYVIQSDRIVTKRPVTLCGDSTKLRRTGNWTPETSFEEFIRMMIYAELNGAG